jgi:putative hydroxymethylpyrimidine transport system substrate-binding protein
MQRVSLVLEYFHPWPNSAGFFVARDRGWFADAGIDLEIRTVDPGRGDSLEGLVHGDVDVAVFPTNRMLVRRELGHDIRALAAVNQRGLETVRTRVDSGIERLRDLEGRRVALNPTPRGRAVIHDLVARDGGDPRRVRLVDAGSRELDPATGFDGLADASFGSYWGWDNLLTTLPPDQERVWRVDEHLGVGYHSYLLGALGTVDAGLGAALVEVSRRGFAAAAAEPQDALRVLETVIPYFPARVIQRSLAEIAPTWFHAGEWGVIREELLGPYAHWLAGHGILVHPERWRDALGADGVALSA